jgi:5-methylcytosine-specific restriction endonuclease McrA
MDDLEKRIKDALEQLKTEGHKIPPGTEGFVPNDLKEQFIPRKEYRQLPEKPISSKRVIGKFTVEGIEYDVPQSNRYILFAQQRECVVCGLKGTKMMLCRQPNQFGSDTLHFAFFGIWRKAMVLLTRDHIVPRSKGGEDKLENIQTMCTLCNKRKHDREISIEDLRQEPEIAERRKEILAEQGIES